MTTNDAIDAIRAVFPDGRFTVTTTGYFSRIVCRRGARRVSVALEGPLAMVLRHAAWMDVLDAIRAAFPEAHGTWFSMTTEYAGPNVGNGNMWAVRTDPIKF